MFRPSGNLHWVLSGLGQSAWSLLGCLGTEERSLTVRQVLSRNNYLSATRLLRIRDAPASTRSVSPFSQLQETRLSERESEFVGDGGRIDDVEEHQLLEAHSHIVNAMTKFCEIAGENVVLDITSLPKRFFFPAIKILVRQVSIRNLVVTYTLPDRYPSKPLALNHNAWAHIPLFSGDFSTARPEMMAVAVGFEALGLPEQVEHGAGLPVRLLLPFPAQPSSFQRSWDLVRKLQSHRSLENLRVQRVDATSVSDTYDSLRTLTQNGNIPIELAPFGPKPTSVAMCLFAIQTGSPVFYTQPTAYFPDYSIGVSRTNGIPNIHAYCLRIEGIDLYAL